MSDNPSVLIVGAGVAGSAAALALDKAGFESKIFEAHSGGAESVGAFLTLATNGIDALRALEADTAALRDGFETPWITLRSGSGKYLGRTPTGLALSDGTPSHTLKRSDLYAALHEQISSRGIDVRYGKRLTGVQRESAHLRAQFADGSDATGDLLIGCDGVHSIVRTAIDGGAPAPRYEGLLTTGGHVRDVPVATEVGSYEMVFGRRAFFGYVLAPDGEVWWFANVPTHPEPSRTALTGSDTEDRRRQLLELFARDAGPACALIEATPEIMPLTPIHTVPRLAKWQRDGMLVIGDAAHAPSPTSGQGASLSIEDAAVLAICLRQEADHHAALARFESVRRPRVERIVRWAARINDSKAPGVVGRVIRDAMMPSLLRLTANSKAHRQTFEHHIEWPRETAGAGARA